MIGADKELSSQNSSLPKRMTTHLYIYTQMGIETMFSKSEVPMQCYAS